MQATSIQSNARPEAYSHSGKRAQKAPSTQPVPVPQGADAYLPSGANASQVEKVRGKHKQSQNSFENFDREAFRAEIQSRLLDMTKAAKSSKDPDTLDLNWLDDILYKVDENEVAAEVPEFWNAENTSQRIVDFAMSFRSLAGELSDEEYMNDIRQAIQQGFKLAKEDLGNLPGPVGKLFNDTYNLTMEKLDRYLSEQNSSTPAIAIPESASAPVTGVL